MTDWILRHRRIVLIGWLLIALVGLGTASRATSALTHDFSLPGHPSTAANERIVRTYGSGGDTDPLVPVVTLPRGVSPDSPQWAAVLQKVRQAVPGGRVASYVDTHDRAFVGKDGRTTFAVVYPRFDPSTDDSAAVALPRVRAALRGATVQGAPVHLTGTAALGDDGSSGGTSVLVETLIGLVGALAILVVVFGSGLAVLPLLIALVAIPTTFLLTWAITTVTSVSFIAQYLIALIGLGVAVDYSLLVVLRWREERDRGSANRDAVRTALRTAGSSVVFSGTTVAIGLAALIALPVPFLRSVGYAGLLIPLVSVLVALTLLPVLLSTVGPRLDRRRLRWARHGDCPSRRWVRWTALVVRHRWAAAIAGVAGTGALLGAALTMRLGYPPASSLASGGSAGAGLRSLQDSGIGAGALTPSEVVTAGDPAGVAGQLSHVDGVRDVVAPAGWWQHGGSGLVEVFTSSEAGSSPAKATVDRILHTVPDRTVGGSSVSTADFIHAVYGSFPLMVALIALVTFVLLARAFRSIVLPLKALALNVLSIGAAWGVMVLVWQHGFGSDALWSIRATGAVTPWVPLMVFAFLFGLSMDYEVFLLSRIREQYDAGEPTDTAVVNGLGHTGRLVTYAALILVLSFVSLSTVPATDVKVLATGLGAGILLDATVVRALLVPALISMLGRANWWLPGRADRTDPEPSRAKIGV